MGVFKGKTKNHFWAVYYGDSVVFDNASYRFDIFATRKKAEENKRICDDILKENNKDGKVVIKKVYLITK